MADKRLKGKCFQASSICPAWTFTAAWCACLTAPNVQCQKPFSLLIFSANTQKQARTRLYIYVFFFLNAYLSAPVPYSIELILELLTCRLQLV